ncbi:MAG: TIGR00341 family protein [Prevotella sp.]|nr:TIGR00341 family protein [Prevotella sp.]MCM1075413.1 TIGR00341 family protein [Ruminococcus sp.]
MAVSEIIKSIKKYFNVSGDLESQSQIEESIRSGVSFRGAQLLVLIFAILVASLGLNTDSIPVIIGAMLISPLMGPIIGMGLGIGIHDYPLLRRGLKNITMAVVGSLIASTIYFLISPQYEGNSQLLARTSPSIYDAFIALFGGAAGILSIAAKNKGQVLPGVAIATSLMPPLCTAGYGLATFQWHFFVGALYLFFTNMVFILFASWIGVKLMRLKPVPRQDSARARRVQTVVYIIVIGTICVSAYLTALMIRKSIFLNEASEFVATQLDFPGTEIFSHKEYIEGTERHIEVTLIGARLPQDSIELVAMKRLAAAGLGGTMLTINQGFVGAPTSTPTSARGEDVTRMYTMMQSQIDNVQSRNDSLQAILKADKHLEDAAVRLAPEVKVVFPGISDMAVSRTVVANLFGEVSSDTVTVLMVRAPRGLSAAEKEKLADYTAVRLHIPSIRVSVNPPSFPWPNREER